MVGLLAQTSHLLQVVEPRLYRHLESKGCQSLVFIFRWLLIHFKREMISVDHVMRLWEVMWTEHLSCDMEVLCAVALLCNHARTITDQDMGPDDMVKWVNGLSGTVDGDALVLGAERVHAIYCRSRVAE